MRGVSVQGHGFCCHLNRIRVLYTDSVDGVRQNCLRGRLAIHVLSKVPLSSVQRSFNPLYMVTLIFFQYGTSDGPRQRL
jgi:hypothetical protein